MPVEVVDMREMPVLGSFDIAFCIDDAIKYLHSAEELTSGAARGWPRTWSPTGC